MKGLVIFALMLALGSAQFPFPLPPFPPFNPSAFPADETYAASLERAPVGLYEKKNLGGYGPYGSGSEVSGASLGGAKVGVYGKEHSQKPVVPVVRPPVFPVRPVVPYLKPVVPYVKPMVPYGRPPYVRPKIIVPVY